MERVFPAAYRMTLRGTKINKTFRAEEDKKLDIRRKEIDQWFQTVLGHPLNPSSHLQMKRLIYGDFNIPVQYHKKTKQPTLDDDALQKIYARNPLLRPLLIKIGEWRSLGVFRNNFFAARLSPDGRMRCTFNLTGTETYRWSSGEDSFGDGTNLQNIPKDKPSKVKLTTGKIETLPNVRKMFFPDVGYVMVEGDLQRADAQVVCWEAGDERLKEMFRNGADIHTENARAIFHVKDVTYNQRQACKQGVHATNYGASARTLAAALGCSVAEAEAFQSNWFRAHPEIKDWQDDVMSQLMTRRYVENKFGYRRFYFDRIDRSLLGEALAWIPQSTVALAINHALANVNEQFAGPIEPLLQVHDSIVVQIKKEHYHRLFTPMRRAMLIEVPYDDPLIIPVTLAASDVSWGDVEELKVDQAKVAELA
jgi:DNA polymerase-1